MSPPTTIARSSGPGRDVGLPAEHGGERGEGPVERVAVRTRRHAASVREDAVAATPARRRTRVGERRHGVDRRRQDRGVAELRRELVRAEPASIDRPASTIAVTVGPLGFGSRGARGPGT